MVVYRVSLTLFFDEEEQARGAFDALARRKALFRTINPGKPNEEKSTLRLEKCYHDEPPPRSCEVVEEITSE